MHWLMLLVILVAAFLVHILPIKAIFNTFWGGTFLAMIGGYVLTVWFCVKSDGPARPH